MTTVHAWCTVGSRLLQTPLEADRPARHPESRRNLSMSSKVQHIGVRIVYVGSALHMLVLFFLISCWIQTKPKTANSLYNPY